jgi:hypothetical protein
MIGAMSAPWKYTFVLILLLAASPAAEAAPLNFYVGGSVGDKTDLDPSDFDVDVGDFGVEGDDTWKVFAGLGIGRIFGVEAAWHDFGTVTCCDQVADAGFALDLTGVSVAAVAGIPISRLRLFAKAGFLAWEADGTLVTIAGAVPFTLDDEDPMGGVGVDLQLTRHFSIRAEWEVFKLAEGSLDIASVGVQYRF